MAVEDAGASPPATDAAPPSADTSPKAATGSDGSADPWCVVMSPTKKNQESPFAAKKNAPPNNTQDDALSEVSDVDLGSGEGGDSDIDEDWGLE